MPVITPEYVQRVFRENPPESFPTGLTRQMRLCLEMAGLDPNAIAIEYNPVKAPVNTAYLLADHAAREWTFPALRRAGLAQAADGLAAAGDHQEASRVAVNTWQYLNHHVSANASQLLSNHFANAVNVKLIATPDDNIPTMRRLAFTARTIADVGLYAHLLDRENHRHTDLAAMFRKALEIMASP